MAGRVQEDKILLDFKPVDKNIFSGQLKPFDKNRRLIFALDEGGELSKFLSLAKTQGRAKVIKQYEDAFRESLPCDCKTHAIPDDDGRSGNLQLKCTPSTCSNYQDCTSCTAQNCSFGSEDCGNRFFNKYVATSFQSFKREQVGMAIRTKKEFFDKEFLMEYTGEVLSRPDALKANKEALHQNATHFYQFQLGSHLFLDARNYGNLARFINHHCNPNARTEIWSVGGEKRVGLFARRDIEADEEITFDYQWPQRTRIWFHCRCGDEHCRRIIGGQV